MVLREMRRHRLNLALSLCSVMAVAACLGAVSTLLELYAARSNARLATERTELETALATLEDDYRKITLKLGFNILILPKEQNLGEFYAENFASKTMPESYVYDLANQSIVTIQHLLPSLQQKLLWPEMNRTILLTGVRDEVPIVNVDAKNPLQQPVPEGGIVLGHELHASLGIKVGDEVTLMGRTFTCTTTYDERGNIDDNTAWVELKAAQEMLDKEGQINGILAVDCRCAWADLPQVRGEIEKILPNTQVIQKYDEAVARAEARWRAENEKVRALKAEEESAARQKRERETLAATVLPLVIAAAAVWVGFLAWSNVRERRPEIGILRAMGWRGSQIMGLFLMRAVLVGLIGGGVGFLLGAVAALGYGGTLPAVEGAVAGWSAVHLGLFACTAVLAPIVSAVAGWIPAQLAALQDPAAILRGE
jgi:hypothetical protein